MLDHIRTLYDYSAWANSRVLDTAEGLTEEQFLADEFGAGAIREMLVHTAAGQWVWLERWQGRFPGDLWEPAEFPDVASLRERWSEIEDATREYLSGMHEADLEREIAYLNFRGERWAYPLWQQLVDQINHATQHRSEAALLLTRFGHSPGDLDLLIYLDERAAAD